MMNFVLSRIGWNLIRIMDPETSFVSQILKQLIKDRVSPTHHNDLIDIIHSFMSRDWNVMFIHSYFALHEGKCYTD